jgi:pantoate--beta-alanine ligase
VIKELINIYNYNINVMTSPTVRNKNGLALSSRNNLLLDNDKKFACDIYHALLSAKIMFENNMPIDQIIDNVNKLFINSHVNIEYFTIRDVKTLQHPNDSDLIALIAGHLGGVRLIDNMIIKSPHTNK